MPFSFLKGENLPELAKQFKLGQYTPEIALEGLATGVDNIRVDVYLSPKFLESTRQHLAKFLPGDPLATEDGGRNILVEAALHLGLVVEEIEMRRPARLKQENHPLRARREVRKPGGRVARLSE